MWRFKVKIYNHCFIYNLEKLFHSVLYMVTDLNKCLIWNIKFSSIISPALFVLLIQRLVEAVRFKIFTTDDKTNLLFWLA